jgi:hypothetical protein
MSGMPNNKIWDSFNVLTEQVKDLSCGFDDALLFVTIGNVANLRI